MRRPTMSRALLVQTPQCRSLAPAVDEVEVLLIGAHSEIALPRERTVGSRIRDGHRGCERGPVIVRPDVPDGRRHAALEILIGNVQGPGRVTNEPWAVDDEAGRG